jgi:hypothetical protein
VTDARPEPRPLRPRGLTGAERLRRDAKALYWLVALGSYGLGVATGCLARWAWAS